ncbi:MAG TPA: hypothetical protein VKQ05_00085 [Gemmatimonadales bacterium]|nr:hypothetical protein [Gemmatimonadales bacterium]
MRFSRVVLALVFGLAMAGPESHASAAHLKPIHHHGGHQPGSHADCPQACCPPCVSVSLPTPIPSWSAAPAALMLIGIDVATRGVLPARARLLPFALAPPLHL